MTKNKGRVPQMKFLEKHPLIMIVIGIAGISLSAIFVKYSQAPSVVTAFYRLAWTVVLMTPVVLKKGMQAGTDGGQQKDCTAVRCQRSVPGPAFHLMV